MKELINSLIEELSARNIYPFAPLGVNFAIQLGWVILKSFTKVATDFRSAQEAKEEGGVGFFISAQLILYLFSFIFTFAIFISLEFFLNIKELPARNYIWWLPSVASIFLMELAKIISKIAYKPKEEDIGSVDQNKLEEKTRQLNVYFWLTIFLLVFLWLDIFFAEDIDVFFYILMAFHKLFL